jgi:hypothetical protein
MTHFQLSTTSHISTEPSKHLPNFQDPLQKIKSRSHLGITIRWAAPARAGGRSPRSRAGLARGWETC